MPTMARNTHLGRQLFQLAAAFILSAAAVVLVACNSSVATEPPRHVAADEQPLVRGPATPKPPSNDDALLHTPSSPDDALDFVVLPSQESASKGGRVIDDDKSSVQRGGGPDGPVKGQPFTWHDGDRTHTVYLQTDLVVERTSAGLPQNVVAADTGGSSLARGNDAQPKDDTLPVFRSESGELMTLPGGVLLVLNAEWSQAQVDSFFTDNGIKSDSITELSYATNGFFIETEPGYRSLELANSLAALDGVELSSPNWGRDASPK